MIRTLAAASLTLLTLALPSAAHAAKGMELALQDDAVFVDERWMARDTALDHAADLKTKRIRVNVLWSRVLVGGADLRTPPAHGAQYDFSKIDALQAAAAKRGIKLQLTITGPAPAWATGDRKIGGNRPDPVKFAAFARTVTAHFKGRVDRYSIWNEPNLSAWLSPSASAPKLYRSLYSSGYTAIKTVDPKAKVLFGELAPNRDGRTIAPLKFLRDVTCSKANYKAARKCPPLKADGLALHPYQLTKAPRTSRRRPGRRADQPARADHQGARQARQAARARHAEQARTRPLPDRVRISQCRRPQARAQRPLVMAVLGLRDRPQEPARAPASAVPARRPARARAVAHRDPGSPRPQAGAVRGPRARRAQQRADGSTIAPSSSEGGEPREDQGRDVA